MELIKCAKELLITNPFYGLFLLNLRKEILPKDHKIKTLGVCLEGLGYVLYVNEGFWNTLTDKEQLAVLTHELCHICFFHLTDHFKADNGKIMNIAMDCAINQNIQNLPVGCVTLESLSDKLQKVLLPKQGSWYYYNEIIKSSKLFDYGFLDIDDHSIWPDEISEAEYILHKTQLESKLKETAEIISKQAGKIPGEITALLQLIKDKPPIFNWKKYFRRLVGNHITSEIILTKMRPSRRLPDARGIKFKRNPKILVGIDVSGSITNEDLQDFFSEIHHMHTTGIKITVVECDTQIQNIFEYNGTQDIKIKGRGGTILTPVIEYYKDHFDYTSCILFTDGCCETTMPQCNNLIWVITRLGNKFQKYSPGNVILIP